MSKRKEAKLETLEEFLARGGSITKVETPPLKDEITVKSTSTGPAQLYSLEDGAHFFAEKREGSADTKTPIKKVEKEDILKNPNINYDLIDEELRRKLGI